MSNTCPQARDLRPSGALHPHLFDKSLSAAVPSDDQLACYDAFVADCIARHGTARASLNWMCKHSGDDGELVTGAIHGALQTTETVYDTDTLSLRMVAYLSGVHINPTYH